MIHNQICLIRPGCLRPSIALTVQNRGLKHHSFIPWKVDNVAHAGLPLLLILSTSDLVYWLNVLGILSNLQWQCWFGIPINNIEAIIDYQLKIKRSKDKATRSLSRFIHDQPMQLGSSNLAYLSALVRRGEKRSLPHWYLFITLLDPWPWLEAGGQSESSGYSTVTRCL